MENHIRVFCFLQRAFKRLDQMMRQFPDKSYGICQKNLLFSRKIQCPCGWIQRGKQLVFLKNPCLCHCIQQCRFACVGVSYDRSHLHLTLIPLAADQFAVLLHLFELFF